MNRRLSWEYGNPNIGHDSRNIKGKCGKIELFLIYYSTVKKDYLLRTVLPSFREPILMRGYDTEKMKEVAEIVLRDWLIATGLILEEK